MLGAYVSFVILFYTLFQNCGAEKKDSQIERNIATASRSAQGVVIVARFFSTTKFP